MDRLQKIVDAANYSGLSPDDVMKSILILAFNHEKRDPLDFDALKNVKFDPDPDHECQASFLDKLLMA